MFHQKVLIDYDETRTQNGSGKSSYFIEAAKILTDNTFLEIKFIVVFAGKGNGITTVCILYVVFKVNNIYDNWTEACPAGTRYNH